MTGDFRTNLAEQLLDRVDQLIARANEDTRPLELDPYHGQLFEVFVTADAAGFLEPDADPELSADVLCRQLAERWGLSEAARMSVERQMKLNPQDVAKMRLLWSVMRMWMEWTYAWRRWSEFHELPGDEAAPPAPQ